MTTTTTLRMLTGEDVIEELRGLRRRQPVKYSAFYSSQLGGVVTDPALMILPFDDHMVHRGHGIFDTAAIVDGKDLRSRSAPGSLPPFCDEFEASSAR